jgi:plastocyanin
VFVPTNLVITVGDTVLWTNQSSTTHDIAEGSVTGGLTASPYWAKATLALLSSFSVTFSNQGIYPYVCNQHVFVTPQPPGGSPTQTGTVTVAAFNFPPTVALTSPSTGAGLLEPASFTMSATADDSDGSVTNIQLFVGSNFVGESATNLANVTVSNLPGGNYTLTARATDSGGLTRTSAPVNVVVSHRVDYFFTAYSPAVLTIKPGESVFFTNTGGPHTVTGTGTEPFCGSGLVSIPSCAVTLNNVGSFPYRCVFHSISQASGMTGTVNVATFNRAPVVSLASPTNGSVLTTPLNLTIRANVFDPDGGISIVQFYSGNTLLGGDSVAPFALNVTSLPMGSNSLTVRVADNQGLRATSAPVNITVAAPADIQLLSPALNNGSFQFNFTASPGLSYVVEGSTGESSPSPFAPLTTNVANTNLMTFIDTAAASRSNRYYRVFRRP